MKNILPLTIALLLGSTAYLTSAQAQVEISGEQTPGSWLTSVSNNSSKFNEYRDIRDGFFFHNLRLDILDTQSGRFVDFKGANLLRNDQSIRLRAGDFGRRLNLVLDYNETPYRLSNKAMTPYIDRGNGLFTVPGQVSIIKDGSNATGTPSLVPTTGQMAVNDDLIAQYLETHLRPDRLAIQRNRTEVTLNLSPVNKIKFRFNYSDERRNGSKTTYGPIGDRPPRTLNVQLQEPVDYTTREVRADAEYAGEGFQTHLRYLFSFFDSHVEAMRWENLFFAPDAGADFTTTVAGTARNVSSFGQRALAPDNYSHQIALSGGFNLPLDSRLTSTAVFGFMRQNERLLPYSFSALGGDLNPQRGDGLNWNDPNKLPRSTADAEMRTLRLDLDYTINPIARLNLRSFVRYYNLDNNTSTTEWKYVTQNTAGTDGDVNYRNYRRNLAYAYDRLSFGLDARHYVSFWRTTLGLGYEREEVDREFRETNTDENLFKASVRTRPADRLSLSAGYVYGDRKGDGYDFNVTSQSYWYSFAQGAADVDNPQFLFANHPDLRKYDVSDRTRNAFDLAATFFARNDLDLTAAYRYRRDNFDSGVVPIAPLTGTAVPLPNPADADALTPGQQLGLLREKRQNVAIDAQYAPAQRWTFHVFADREYIDSGSRGMIFNENQRREPSNPGIQAPTQLGPWTDPDRLYNTRTEERTNTLGLGVGYEIFPGRLRVSTDYSLSRGKVDLDYTGYGSDAAFLGRDWETFQFGFNNPETIRQNHYVLNASLAYQPLERVTFGVHYLFDRYRLQDWIQAPAGPWVEQVGSEFFLRDTSQDNRWGNRLVNQGSLLAPGYQAHVVSMTMTYRF